MIVRAAYGSSRDRGAVYDQVAMLVDLFAFVPGGLRIEIQA